ncbi:hypothetical protein [Burkholderia ubonensis]|uniref:hypothetical protein n=1 Tax=Burkholderia ubonensis TaxID=101571 RepID=UPI001160F7EF|nr:hypothetical protein [Burkholderia ubonensis]
MGVGAPLGYGGLRWAASLGCPRYTIDQGIVINSVADTASLGVVHPCVRGLDLNLNGALDLLQTRTRIRIRCPDFGFSVHSRLSYVRATLLGNNGERAQQLGLSQWQGQLALTARDQSNDDPRGFVRQGRRSVGYGRNYSYVRNIGDVWMSEERANESRIVPDFFELFVNSRLKL